MAGGAGVVDPVVWPGRDASRLAGVIERTPGGFNLYEARRVIHQPRDGAAPKAPSDRPPDFEVVHVGVHGQGVLRVIAAKGLTFVVEDVGPDAQALTDLGVTIDATLDSGKIARNVQIRAKYELQDELFRFVSYSTLPNRPVSITELLSGGSGTMVAALRAWRRDLSNTPISDADLNGARVLSEGLAAYLVSPPKGVSPRGLIVHLGGTGSARFEKPLVNELARSGWNVLSVPFVGLIGGNNTLFALTQSGRFPDELAELAESPTTAGYRDPIAGSSQISLTTVLELHDTPEQLGARFAAITDDRLAEPAYFVEALLDYIAKSRPELLQGPLVLLGCSAGAIVAPAVAARLPGRFDAAVLVGGGCNLLDVGLRSALELARPQIVWDSTKDIDDQKARAVAAYIEHSKLDPLRAASSLRSTPTLMLHARFDRIVPADSGIKLWEALGKPERHTFLGGHEGLFVLLSDHDDAIDDWLNRTLPRAAKAAPATAPAR